MHWIIAPVILPAMMAPLIAYVMRHDLILARAASAFSTAALVGVALYLFGLAHGGETFVYRLGDWPAPFGIVLVLDQLSALMVLMTSLLALLVLIHAITTNWDARGKHFHALFQFQLMGICGAFLTGDVFNLFVFFEVLLIASYGLMIHGGGKERMRAGLQYVVMNLAGSTLFLFALGTLYATTGTLNLADLALRVDAMSADAAAMVRVSAILLLLVFALKAALVPLQFWLPGTYANAPAVVAALFAIMTKVGAYAIIRVHGIAFGPEMAAMGDLVSSWLVPAAGVSLIIGALGVFGAKRLGALVSFAVIASMGTIMLAIAPMTPDALAAGLYYLIHSTFAAAALFLIVDLLGARRGRGDALVHAAPLAQNGLYAGLFMMAAIAMAGMPPLSGFLGKLMILEALYASPQMVWAYGAILGGSLVLILGFVRAGSILFWKSVTLPVENEAGGQPPVTLSQASGLGAALALLLAVTAFAGPIHGFTQSVAGQIHDASGYIEAVMPDVAPMQAGAEPALPSPSEV